jgi:SAM-dependent methyltransferase
MAEVWSMQNINDPLYRAKFVNCPDIIEDWLSEHGGLAGRDVLEFGCGEGTMSLGMALRKETRRVVGVEILDVLKQCLHLARREIRLESLPANLDLFQITPGQQLLQFGQFDLVYSWSVFEHVSQDLLAQVLSSIKAVLKPQGLFFLQISPLYYSSNGSHMGPWVKEPWAHLSMQEDAFHRALLTAAPTPANVRSEWSVYIPIEADTPTERAALWDTYITLNKVTATQLCRMVREAGLEIVRDYRTKTDAAVPPHLAEIYQEDVLTTEQIVLLMRRA